MPDSRVAAELIFDQGLGDMFVVRTAGQAIDSAVLGSIEYAVAVLDGSADRGSRSRQLRCG